MSRPLVDFVRDNRGRRIPKALIEERENVIKSRRKMIRELLSLGCKKAEIARLLKTTPTAIHMFIRRHGLTAKEGEAIKSRDEFKKFMIKTNQKTELP